MAKPKKTDKCEDCKQGINNGYGRVEHCKVFSRTYHARICNECDSFERKEPDA